MRIFLTGFMGSGKTAVGRLLAAELGIPFIDLDREVELQVGMSVAEFFRRDGEAAFRARESAALEAIVRFEDAVVATGGGVVLSAANRDFLAAHGTTFWLNPSFATLAARLGGKRQHERPLFHNLVQAEELWHERLALYRTADCELAVAPREMVGETVKRVLAALEERSCAT